jgi:integrase/recombinase XerD
MDSVILNYLNFCEYQKNLNHKTLKAYKIDLTQFYSSCKNESETINKASISEYISFLHTKYKPKSVKRKIASLKAFCSYLENEEKIEANPFSKIKLNYKEPFHLPKVVSLNNLHKLFTAMYKDLHNCDTNYKLGTTLRSIAVIELLFATGMRVSELCSLSVADVDLSNKTIRIFGKGARERILQIENTDVLNSLQKYFEFNRESIMKCGYFFVNKLGKRLSDQSVRGMLNDYTKRAQINLHITPHMIRHSFATLLLEEDVDIRYIQQMLGHSSITTTQIYTHVASSKQKQILLTKHPRNKLVCI